MSKHINETFEKAQITNVTNELQRYKKRKRSNSRTSILTYLLIWIETVDNSNVNVNINNSIYSNWNYSYFKGVIDFLCVIFSACYFISFTVIPSILDSFLLCFGLFAFMTSLRNINNMTYYWFTLRASDHLY